MNGTAVTLIISLHDLLHSIEPKPLL